MISEGRIPLTPAEHEAVDKLIREHDGEPVSFTREDPGDTGPLLVHVGEQTWRIGEDGKRKKVA